MYTQTQALFLIGSREYVWFGDEEIRILPLSGSCRGTDVLSVASNGKWSLGACGNWFAHDSW